MTEIQEKTDALRDRINGATDIDKLKDYSLKIVDLLVKVDQLVNLGEERRALVTSKLASITKVAEELIKTLEMIKSTTSVLDNVPSFDKTIEAARIIIED